MDPKQNPVKFFISAIIITVCVMNSATGQGLYARCSAEATVAGFRYGGAIGYIAKSQIQGGIFYQQSLASQELSPSVAQNFAGLEILLPFIRGEKVYFSGHMRAGVADRIFILLVPGVRTSLRIVPGIEAGFGMHWRYHKPAHELSIQFKI
jgi:hypothetical protein